MVFQEIPVALDTHLFFFTSLFIPQRHELNVTYFRGKVGEVHHVHAHHGTDEYLEGGDPGAEYAFVKNTLPQAGFVEVEVGGMMMI